MFKHILHSLSFRLLLVIGFTAMATYLGIKGEHIWFLFSLIGLLISFLLVKKP